MAKTQTSNKELCVLHIQGSCKIILYYSEKSARFSLSTITRITRGATVTRKKHEKNEMDCSKKNRA